MYKKKKLVLNIFTKLIVYKSYLIIIVNNYNYLINFRKKYNVLINMTKYFIKCGL